MTIKKKDGILSIMSILFVTKILGFLKLRIIAQLFGVSHELDIFWAAFTIPDLIFTILVAGSINAAIIPIFSDVLYGNGRKSLEKLFYKLTVVFSIICLVLVIGTFISAPYLAQWLINTDIAQKYLDVSGRLSLHDIDTFVMIMRITLLSPFLLGISSLMTAYLQVRNKFFVPALAPLFYNLAMILGPIVFVVGLGLGVEGLAYSAVLGSLLHLLIQLPTFLKMFQRRSMKGALKNLWKDSRLRAVVKLATPRILGVFGEQFNVFVNTLISFTLSVGALSAYKFAYSLHLFPVNIIGSAFAQVTLPDLAKYSKEKDLKEFKKVFNNAVQFSMYLILPIVAVLIVLRLPIVRLAYGVGAFDWRATLITAWCLALLGFSVIGQTLIQLILRAFYALKETWLPLLAIFLGIISNLFFVFTLTNMFSHYYDWRPILDQIFLQIGRADGVELLVVLKSFVTDLYRWMTTRGDSDMSVGGLALALSFTSIIQVVLASLLLNVKHTVITWKETIRPFFMKFLNTIIMGTGMYFVFKLFDFKLDTTRTVEVVILTVIVCLYGAISYALGSEIFDIKEYEVIEKMLNGFGRKAKKILNL